MLQEIGTGFIGQPVREMLRCVWLNLSSMFHSYNLA